MPKLKKLGTKALEILKGVAPTVATALGGPWAGVAVRTLSKALFGNEDTPMDDIEAALLSGDSDTLLKAQAGNHEFELKMKELNIREEELQYADIASARQREISVRDKMPMVLGILAFVQWYAVLFVILFGKAAGIELDSGQMTTVMFVLATAQAIVLAVISYYFGSSQATESGNRAFADYLKTQR